MKSRAHIIRHSLLPGRFPLFNRGSKHSSSSRPDNSPLPLNALLTIVMLYSGLIAGCGNPNDPGTDPILNVPADEMPAWSPGGDSIAYYHFNPDVEETDYPTGLYVLDLQTGQRRLVVQGQTLSPDWSPDGQWLAFSSGDIYRIRPDDRRLEQLTFHGKAFNPRWSPDGTAISYGRSGTQEEVGIWFLLVEDFSLTKFGFGATPADWSRNSDHIVFQGPPGDSEEGGNQIWKADTSGTGRRQLTANSFVGNRDPAWSPDGQWIAWSTLHGAMDWGLWVMRSDGSEQRELLRLAPDRRISYEHVAPAWGPDSERIVFSRPNAEETKVTLWIINRDGSGLKQITF